MLLRSILTGAAFAALIPASASAAPTIDPLKRCYVAAQETQREYVIVTAAGFTPLSTVDVYIDDILQENSPRALFDGKLTGQLQAPFVDSGQRAFTVRLAEQGNAANTAAAVSKVTRFSVEQVPKEAKTDDRVLFRGRGFTAVAPDLITRLPVYAHYIFGGKSKRTVTLGVPKGDCGTFSVRRKQFPFQKRPLVGVWTIQFDQLPYYDPNARAKVPMNIRVHRAPKIKPKRARAH
jgi:hypothetical protein